ncbi:BAP31 protein, partial [Asarcornis scutulata]|nr:BAP31 protein [Asarcornis scutulata]
LLRRLVTLISQQALLGASSQAFRKQAEGASQAARRYMEDNEALRKVGGSFFWGWGGCGGGPAPPPPKKPAAAAGGRGRGRRAGAGREREPEGQALEKAENEVQAMRRQAEGLTREYDRLLDQHARLQAAHDGPRDKKEE